MNLVKVYNTDRIMELGSTKVLSEIAEEVNNDEPIILRCLLNQYEYTQKL